MTDLHRRLHDLDEAHDVTIHGPRKTTGDWPKIPYGQPKAKISPSQQVFVPTLPYEVHRTNEKHEMEVIASGNSSAYIMRICRLLREDEKLHNRKYRDVAIKVWDHVTHKYLSY